MGTENSSGPTVDAIEVNGIMENNMVREPTSPHQARRSTVNGEMVNASDGLEWATKTEPLS